MIQNIYKKWPISINHVWYMENESQIEDLEKANAFFLHGVNDINPKGVVSRGMQHTLISDLSIPKEENWAKFSSTIKRHINKCIKEECRYEILGSEEILKRPEIIDRFVTVYKNMFSSKGMDVSFNKDQFDSYVEKGFMFISVAYIEDEPVVFHANIVEGERSRSWYSCSDFRNDKKASAEIGRLNEYLHWMEMLEYGKRGIRCYDWGGVNFDDPKVKGISEFKAQFGGELMSYENIVFTSNPILKILLKFKVRL